MFREIVINSNPSETRIAVLEDAQLVELLLERAEERRLVGDIYKGRVSAVLPGIQAAFVEIGLPKAAFLHMSDMLEAMLDFEDFDIDDDPQGPSRSRSDMKIEDYLQKNQEILVQIIKEPIGTKGPKVSGRISLPGRFLVLMPGLDHIGVSRRISDRDERQRLRKILTRLKPANAGLICRTVGDGKGEKEFEQDVKYLLDLWEQIDSVAASSEPPALIHREMEMVTGLIRDLFTEEIDRVVIDAEEAYRQILAYLKVFSPDLKNRVKLYRGDGPIFDEHDIESEIAKTLERKVWLKKGGYIVIDQTEALIAIDVNTGRFTGKRSPEDTILKTNVEAAKEIARQLRLRDVGGLIVIDFIDMEQETSKRQVFDTMKQALRTDRARTKVFPLSELGLVEMTRQRERPSVLHYYSEDCFGCGGSGKVLSCASLAMKVDRFLRRIAAHSKERHIQLRVHPELATYLYDERSETLASQEKQLGLTVDLRDDPRLRRDDIRIWFPRLRKDVTAEFQG
ncbi:MAG: Rne/Rng family ribonuclease [Candidatus Eisenbacteria bacterium]|nr:Rne/Rng family ribonuclease [Candidatus Latescibacterota bacterium]MBD3303370.1 Rne/Rng family ribonuclease [Candidatus Eisenbacteria bacterium]